jgi:hypothetical protein
MTETLSNFELGRRVAFMLDSARRSLGLEERHGPHAVQQLAVDVLDAGMAEPAKVDPKSYAIAYLLAEIDACP